MKLIYLTTCASDYFQGFGGPTLAIGIDEDTTYDDVKKELARQIREYDIDFGDMEVSSEQEDDLLRQVESMFSQSPLDKPWSDHVGPDSYAYFGVKA
jgi:hypothetical protein